MRALLYVAAVAVVAAPALVKGQDRDNCRYEADRQATVDAAGVRLLDLEAGAGSLKVVGTPGLTAVRIRGRACASERDLLDQIKLDAVRAGGTIRVKANADDHDFHFSWHGNEYARLDVVVEVPAGMAARIDDGSGEMELSALGDTEITDGSGGIEATDLASARIEDGSGEITLTKIRGAVDIEDGSGGIDVRGVGGTVTVEDGSGSISVADVAGDFIVSSDGSGGVDYDNVRGHVSIPERHRHRGR